MSAPRPQRVILGDRTADLSEEYVFPYVQLYTVWYLVVFLKANLTKFTVMQSEKGKKAGFLRQKYQETQYRGKRKGEKERARRTKGLRRREKSNGCTLRFIMATLESFWPKKTV